MIDEQAINRDTLQYIRDITKDICEVETEEAKVLLGMVAGAIALAEELVRTVRKSQEND